MERVIKKIVSSVLVVKGLFKNLNQGNNDYLSKAKVAVSSYQTLIETDKESIMKNIPIKYKYFDAKAAIQKEKDIESSKPVVKLLLALNIDSGDFEKNAKLALKEYRNLSPSQTAIVLRNKAANIKLGEAKSREVINTFLALDSTLGTYMIDAGGALKDYKDLSKFEKTLVNNHEKAYSAYNLARVNTVKCLLMKYNPLYENHLLIGRDALSMLEDLLVSDKEHINSNLFYRNKISMINMALDKLSSEILIKKLHKLFLASLQTCLTNEYFTYALRIISEYEGATSGAKALVEAQAALELQIARDGKEAHPVVCLIESFLPEKKHSKYYEIADLLVSAYEVSLTRRQKKYVNKNTYTMELLNEAKKELAIKEQII